MQRADFFIRGFAARGKEKCKRGGKSFLSVDAAPREFFDFDREPAAQKFISVNDLEFDCHLVIA